MGSCISSPYQSDRVQEYEPITNRPNSIFESHQDYTKDYLEDPNAIVINPGLSPLTDRVKRSLFSNEDDDILSFFHKPE